MPSTVTNLDVTLLLLHTPYALRYQKKTGPTFVTFAFLIGELMVCQAKPSLLEVFHTKSFSSLCSLDHEPGKQDSSCYNTLDSTYACIHIK